jgi:hypothetical protein
MDSVRGKDGKLFELSRLYRTSKKTVKDQEPIKIIKNWATSQITISWMGDIRTGH